MHYLVAGCGWLGSEVARRLVARGDRVTALVRTDESARRLRALGLEAYALDVTAERAWDVPPSCDGVVSAIAAAGPAVADYRRAYVEATRRMLESEVARNVPFVYVSSTGVLGRSDGSWVDEATPASPADANSEVLLAAERLVLEATSLAARPIVVRCSGLYGPGRSGVIERVRSGALAWGAGDDAWMNFSHRDDAATVVIAALDRGEAGSIYHATDATPSTRHDVVAWIAGRLGVEPGRSDAAGSWPGRSRPNRRVSGEATRRELDLSLAYPSFREGLAPLLARGDA